MSLTVLVVDDYALNVKLLRRILEAAGHAVLAAADAETGLEIAAAEQPDVVVMDVELPGIDGFEATRRLHADPRTAAIPVVAVTAHVLSGVRQRALDAGCVDFLTKPVDVHEFATAIASAARRR